MGNHPSRSELRSMNPLAVLQKPIDYEMLAPLIEEACGREPRAEQLPKISLTSRRRRTPVFVMSPGPLMVKLLPSRDASHLTPSPAPRDSLFGSAGDRESVQVERRVVAEDHPRRLVADEVVHQVAGENRLGKFR